MALKDVLEGAAGTIIGGGSYMVARSAFIYSKKRDSEGDVKVEVKDAIAGENRITKLEVNAAQNTEKLDFIVAQLGKNPNGGNAMQQILDGNRETRHMLSELSSDTSSKLLDLTKHILEIGANLTSHVVHHKE